MQYTEENMLNFAVNLELIGQIDKNKQQETLALAASWMMGDNSITEQNVSQAAHHYISQAIIAMLNKQQQQPAQQQPAQQQPAQQDQQPQHRGLDTFYKKLRDDAKGKSFEEKLEMLDILLPAESINFRVGTAKDPKKGYSLLAYKDARVDQDVLDAVMGKGNWKTEYRRDCYKDTKILTTSGELKHSLNKSDKLQTVFTFDRSTLICKILVKNDNGEWIGKESNGVESNTEEEKGQYSDALKRAGFMLGIGRRLYDMPFIWIKSIDEQTKWDINTNRWTAEVEDDGSTYTRVKLIDEKGRLRFNWNKKITN